MSELPPNASPPDDVDDRYRRAAALDDSRPSDSARRSILEYAATLAAQRSLERPAEDIPMQLGVERSAANQRWWRPAVFGTLAAAGLAGLLIAPRYLPPRASNTVAQSKIEATRAREDTAPSPPAAASQPPAMPPQATPPPVVSQSPLPPSPRMAQRQSTAKDRAAAGNAAAIADSAQDKEASDVAPPKGESHADARNAPAEATGATAATSAGAGAGATGVTESLTANLAGRVTEARNRESDAALRRAAESGDVQGLQSQLAKRSDIDARDAGGRTALMLATLHGQLRAVDALLSAGADANVADAAGVTPLQAAMNANQPDIAAALRRAGAR